MMMMEPDKQHHDRADRKKVSNRGVNPDLRDYVALMVALCETTMLPLVLLAIVVGTLGIAISMIFLH